MAAFIGSAAQRPEEARKWTEAALIGTGLLGLLVLVVILYFGF